MNAGQPQPDPPADDPTVVAAKAALRERLIAARRARTDADRSAARTAIANHLRASLSGCRRVAAYLPLPSEPLPPRLLLDLAADGITVLLPIVTGASPLDWAPAGGPTVSGARGIDEPAGPGWGPDAIGTVDVVLVPALAVDHRGARLGRGGGHYDRTLAPLPPGRPRLIAVTYDDEVIDRVPTGPLDRPVDAVVTPSGGLSTLDGSGPGPGICAGSRR